METTLRGHSGQPVTSHVVTALAPGHVLAVALLQLMGEKLVLNKALVTTQRTNSVS